jgi:hypothetical protein
VRDRENAAKLPLVRRIRNIGVIDRTEAPAG